MDKQKILENSNLHEPWKSGCFISDDGTIFPPLIATDGNVLATGEENYANYLAQNDTPLTLAPPTIEQRTAALESAMLAILGGATHV